MHCYIFQNKDGNLLYTCSSGKLFNLSCMCPKNIRCVLVCEVLYANDAVFVARFETEIQDMCHLFAVTCDNFWYI